MEYKIKLGRNISAERNRAGLTQNKLAELIGVNLYTITSWENGYTSPDALNIYKLSVACNCKADAFYVGFDTTDSGD